MCYALCIFMYLLIIFTILFFILAWRRLDTAIALLLFLLPTYQLRFSLFGLPVTLLEVMILVSFFVWFIKETEFANFLVGKYKFSDYLLNHKRRRAYPFGKGIILFIIASFSALAVAHFSNQALGIWKAYFFEPVLMYILLLNRFGKEEFSGPDSWFKKMEFFLWPLFGSAFVLSLFAVFQKITGFFIVASFWPRVTSVFAYPNALGLYLGPLIILMAAYLLVLISSDKRKEKWDKEVRLKIVLVFLSLVFSLIAVFLARSEGAFVGLFAVFILGLFCFFFQSISLFKYFVSVLAVLIFIFVLLSSVFFLKVVPEYSYPDFGNVNLNEVYDKLALKDFSGEVRKQQWRETFMMMKDNGRWFFGTGLSGYQANVKPYHQEGIFFNAERDSDFRRKLVLFDKSYRAKHWRPVEIYMYPHNLILNFWTEMGLLGVLAFIFLVGSFFKTGYALYVGDKINNSKEKLMALGLLGVMMVSMVHGMVDVPFFKNDLAVLFFFFFGVLGILKISPPPP